MRRGLRLIPPLLLLPALLFAQLTPLDRSKLPFGTIDDAFKLRGSMGMREFAVFVHDRICNSKLNTALDHFLTAELLKLLGDYRASEYYERAIAADPSEPVYELLYADYLRNVRGAGRPLFPQAERHYFEALTKLAGMTLPPSVRADDFNKHVGIVLGRIDRGLVTLYQEDGLPLGWSGSRPVVFLSSIDRMAHSTSDLDEVHDTRDFTAEALLARSVTNPHRELTQDELRSIVRLKEPGATYEQVRFRDGNRPVLDFFYQDRSIGNAQITDFFRKPGELNRVGLRDLGMAVEKPFTVVPFDVDLRAAYTRLQRMGVVQFTPSAKEDIDQLDLRAAGSTFVGPDKLSLNATVSFQNIATDIANPPVRNRQILGIATDYQILRPLPGLMDPYGQLFADRGVHLLGGLAVDRERFGPTEVTRRDAFLGTSVNGLGPVDLLLQPGYIDSRVSGDASQSNSQFRTNFTIVVRLLNEERAAGLFESKFLGLYPAFVNLVLPFKRDVSLEGLNAFENYKVGAALNVKLFRRAFSESSLQGAAARARPATILVSASYDRQWFSRLDKTLNLYSLSVSVGY